MHPGGLALATEVFPIRGPVPHDDVVDREAFIEQVGQRLLDGHSVVIAAPRRLGKSSVGHEVLRRLRNREQTRVAAIDLAATPSMAALAERLTVACLASVSPTAQAVTAARGALVRLSQYPEVRAKMHDLELSVALRPPQAQAPDALLDEALALPDRITGRDGRRLVLMFDEFQLASAVGGTILLDRLRSAFQGAALVSLLFLGSQAGLMAQLFGDRRQPFFPFADMLALPPVPAAAWRDYLAQRFGALRTPASDAAIDLIVEYTGGHPQDTMRAAYEAYLLGRASHSIDAHLAAGACQEAQTALADVFEAELDGLGLTARVLLTRIANGEEIFTGARTPSTVARTLRDLTRQGVLSKLGRGRYAFVESMMARHLR